MQIRSLLSITKSMPLSNPAGTAALKSGNATRVLRNNWWTLFPLALACAATATPYLLTHDSAAFSFALRRGFALICHQRPERSFWIFGMPVAVCARCLGIYLGAAVGLVMRTSRRIAMLLLFAAAASNLLDAAAEIAGLHGNWMGLRFGLGLALGGSAALLISSASSRTSAGVSMSP